MFHRGLSKRFKKTYQFCDGNINKSCLMLWKGIYSYEDTTGWYKFNEKRYYQQRRNSTAIS